MRLSTSHSLCSAVHVIHCAGEAPARPQCSAFFWSATWTGNHRNTSVIFSYNPRILPALRSHLLCTLRSVIECAITEHYIEADIASLHILLVLHLVSVDLQCYHKHSNHLATGYTYFYVCTHTFNALMHNKLYDIAI